MRPRAPVGDYELERELAPNLFIASRGGTPVLLRIAQVGRPRAFVQMRLDESRIATWFVHPHLGRVIDIGQADEYVYFAYEHIAAARMLTLDVTREAAIESGVQLCSALQHLHEARSPDGAELQCVHGGVNPESIVLDASGRVKLLDYLTIRGQDTGSIRTHFKYLSPEQASGEDVDHRTDQYSLGRVLWELTVGQAWFRATLTDYQIIEQIRSQDIEPPSAHRPDYPRALERVLMRALSRAREARFPTMAAFGDALAGCTN